MRNEDYLHMIQQDSPEPRSDMAFDMVRDYRYQLSLIIDKAKRHADYCAIDWKAAKIYKVELEAIPVPPVPDYCRDRDLGESVEELRKLVK